MRKKGNDMRLSPEELQSFIDEALNKIQLDLIRGNGRGELREAAEKYNLLALLDGSIPSCDFYKSNVRRAKILVLAIQMPNVDDWKLRAKKKYGIPSDRIEFLSIKSNFNFAHLKYTNAYSDIIVGPVPHKGVGIDDNSSFLAAAERHPEDYPKVHRMTDSSGELTLSQSAFERCLDASNFIRECVY